MTATAEDVALLEAWYKGLRGDARKTLPQSIEAVVQGWGKVLDRARGWKAEKERKRQGEVA